MDEPTSGLDPVTRSEMLDVFWDYIQDENNTIFISSHITSDLERIADTITFIHNGKLLLTDNKDNILNSHGIIKCSKDDIDSIPTDNIVSIKTTEHTTSVMVKDRNNPIYSDFIMDNTTLDEILLFYVRGINQMRWSV
jgi:ABC-2 type transport system ATP-binding protein